MGLASIANTPVTQETLNAWAFSHQGHHFDINRVIYETKKRALPQYILDPMNLDAVSLFLYQHQAWHNAVNSVLEIDGYNLLDVDWTDFSARESWVYLHFNEHYQWNQKLGV